MKLKDHVKINSAYTIQIGLFYFTFIPICLQKTNKPTSCPSIMEIQPYLTENYQKATNLLVI